jgi:hypothetical protein
MLPYHRLRVGLTVVTFVALAALGGCQSPDDHTADQIRGGQTSPGTSDDESMSDDARSGGDATSGGSSTDGS